LHETDRIGLDQIPWDWPSYFTAGELVLNDTLSIEDDRSSDGNNKKKIVREGQSIRAKLHPLRRGYHETRYSMFGTDRTISTFELSIEKLQDGDEQEECKRGGCPSYNSEVDFRKETEDDVVCFNLYVRPETFGVRKKLPPLKQFSAFAESNGFTLSGRPQSQPTRLRF
jgi:hypothetical protein